MKTFIFSWVCLLVFLPVRSAALPPMFITLPSHDTLFEAIQYHKLIQAHDPEHDSFYFQVPVKPAGLIDLLWNDSTLELRWLPLLSDTGIHPVTMIIQDTTGLKDTLELVWHVFKKNDPPVFIQNHFTDTIQQNDMYRREIVYYDPDGDHGFTFTVIHKPFSMMLNTTFSDSSILADWQPLNQEVGEDSLVVIIRDDSLATDTLRARFTVLNRNDPPRFIPDTFQDTLSQGQYYRRAIKVLDGDLLDSLRFNPLRIPDSLKVNFGYSDTSILMEWTPEFNQIGRDSLIIQVFDDSLAMDTLKGYFTILNLNDPPHPGIILFPYQDLVLTSLQLDCQILKSHDPDPEDTLLSYRFILSDDSFFSPGFSDWASPWIKSSNDTIAYSFPDNLREDNYYYFTAQVRDDSMEIVFYNTVRFFVNSVNQLPSFEFFTPAESSIIPVRSPRFTVTEPSDSDDSVFFYSFILMNGTGSEMIDSAYHRNTNQYTTEESLLENGKFQWTARVLDESGGFTDWKPLRSFYVNSQEEAPFTPQNFWIYGLDSSSHYITVSNPTFTWDIPSLPDPDPLTQKSDLRFLVQIYSDTNSLPIYQVNSEKGGTNYFFAEGDLVEREKYFARITATDPTNLHSKPSGFLFFYIDLENNKPSIISEPDTVAQEDRDYRYTLKVYDDEMDKVRIVFVLSPQGMGLDSGQIHYEHDTLYAPIIWQPSAVQLGVHKVRLNIWDQMDRVVIQEYNLRVYNTNDPPEILRPPTDTLYNLRVGDNLSLSLECRDEDSIDSLRYQFLQKPDWLNRGSYIHQLIHYSLAMQGTPDSAHIGMSRVVFKVVDDSGATVIDSFRIAVHNQNLPPSIPVLISPLNKSRVSSSKRPVLRCLASTDSDPEDTVLTYLFEIATDSLFANIVTSVTNIQSVQNLVEWTVQMDLTENMTYYWRVRAFDTFHSASDYSFPFRFMINTVDDPPSIAPEILYPRSYQIFHNSDSLIFRFRNPSDPDTPIDSLRGYMYIYLRQNGNVLYKNDSLKFNWKGNYTEVNLSLFYKQNITQVENQWMQWRVLVQDNSFQQASSRLDTFAVSFTDEPPSPVSYFLTRKDEKGYVFDDIKLETNNDYVFFQWAPSVPPAPDPEDSITNISYRISIFQAVTGLVLVDSLFTGPDARSTYSHEDKNLIIGSFRLQDNIRYRAGIQSMDQNNKLSSLIYGPCFLYNNHNDMPYQPAIVGIEDMDNNHILRNTQITLRFETQGDPDFTDSIQSLIYLWEVSSDSLFTSLVLSDSLTYSQAKLENSTPPNQQFSFTLPDVLPNYQIYYIRIHSRDDELLFSDWSQPVWVEIQAGNRPPEKPLIIFPDSGQEITNTNLPLIRIHPPIDPDGQSLYYFFRLYEILTATYLIDSSDLVRDTTWSSRFFLSENTHYRLTVRAFDGELYSPADSVDFYINQEIEPPTVPLLFRIKDLKNGVLGNKLPTYTWQGSVDPDPFDPETIYYQIGLFAAADTASLLRQYTDIREIRYLTPETDSLTEDSSYSARIRSRVDKNFQHSFWSEAVFFKINTQNQSPIIELQGALTEDNQVFKGIIEIRWICYDQDEDSLSIALEYSGDYGNSWTPLPGIDARGDSIQINDSLYYWNCNDSYTQYGEKNSRIRVSVSDGSAPVSAVSAAFTIARSSGPQPKVFSPVYEKTRINFSMDQPGSISIRIYNMARKLVRRLATDMVFGAGDYFVEWDGRDDQGTILPNRMYFIVIEKPDGKREYSSVVIMQK